MPVNANVYSDSGLPEGVTKLADMLNPATIQAKQLALAQGQEQMQGIQSARQLRDFMAQNPNAGLQDLTSAARAAGNLTAAGQFQAQDIAAKKAGLEGQQTQLKIVKQKLDNVNPLLGAVFANPTDEAIKSTMGAAEARGEIPAGTTQQFLSLPPDPMARRKLIAEHGLDPQHLIEQSTPKLTPVNGQIVDTNPNTTETPIGTTIPAQLPPQYKRDANGNLVVDPAWLAAQKDIRASGAPSFGAPITVVTPNGPQTIQPSMRGGQPKVLPGVALKDSSVIQGDSTKTGDAYIATLPPALQGKVRAMINGDIPYPTLRTDPNATALQQAAIQADPSYSATRYGTKQKSENDFATGSLGNQVRQAGNVVEHTGTMLEVFKGLRNGTIPFSNEVANRIAQMTGQPAPTSAATGANILGGEISKVIVGGPGAEEDRRKAAAGLNINASPEQQAASFGIIQKLLGTQLKDLENQKKATTGSGIRPGFLNPSAQKFLDAARAEDTAAPSAVPHVTMDAIDAEMARRKKK